MNEDIFKYRAWVYGKWMDYDFWLHADGEIYERTEKTYNTPNIEIEKYDSQAIKMQCTGQKDKNGRLIYVGDIFGSLKQFRCVVTRQINGAYELVFLDKHITPWSIADKRVGTSKIIGNIYQNPELLEKDGG